MIEEGLKEIADLNKEIEDTQKEVVFTMGSIGESRSKETGNHVKRVAEYSKVLALAYGLSEDEAELLRTASPMHDIGKVAIPDAVLKKPGRLDKDEFEIMKTHAQLGYEMLKMSHRPILHTASIVAYEHHERWDGKGYPRGLKGEQIHIYGRITAIADVFDALGSKRVYKPAWDDEKIFNLFKEERGKQFDPKLVDLFFENIDKFLEIRDRFADVK
jgi:response regulator RpfG family c-di-GMP phosphodiesterase